MLSDLALSDNGFLFDTKSGLTFSLNATATVLLKSLIDGRAESELADGLVEDFEIDTETANRDVELFLIRLRDIGVYNSEAS